FESRTGAGYRHVADLAGSPPGLWAVDAQSQSGHPGSPHYADQFPGWLRGEYHYLPLGGGEASRPATSSLTLEPSPGHGPRRGGGPGPALLLNRRRRRV